MKDWIDRNLPAMLETDRVRAEERMEQERIEEQQRIVVDPPVPTTAAEYIALNQIDDPEIIASVQARFGN